MTAAVGGRRAGTNNKELRRLLDRIEQAGGELRRCKHGSHWKVYLDGRFIGTVGGSPSDHRSWKNGLSFLRRNGLQI
ncbi:hypothetical protein SEA_WOOPER_75 [Gordonia phage Wooper]|nr:hypothetical protein SEA_WOOPER_75 [Gordonia phage Wooper]